MMGDDEEKVETGRQIGPARQFLRWTGKVLGTSALVVGLVGIGVKVGVDNYAGITSWYESKVREHELSSTRPHSDIYRDWDARTRIMRRYEMLEELEEAVEPFCEDIDRIGHYSCSKTYILPLELDDRDPLR